MSAVSTDQTERVGVHAVSFILADFGWFPKEAARPDYGVDLFVETSTEDGRPSGRLLAVQVKSRSNYLSARGGGTLYVDQAHVDYWRGYSVPVIVVLYDRTPESRTGRWSRRKPSSRRAEDGSSPSPPTRPSMSERSSTLRVSRPRSQSQTTRRAL